ncbi:MAG: hypothetical protein GX639_20935 [Fibrobacter sp.]|nr:hypothetical protein [Fibrobacter sp.]
MNLSKSEKTTGIILASLLLLITLASTCFFLGKLRVSMIEWIAFNSCSPSSFLYLIFFIIFLINKKGALLIITALPLYYLGTMSMFVLPWDGNYVVAHIRHIIMTLNIAWVFFVLLKYKEYRAIALGLLTGIILFVPFIAYVQTYNKIHEEKMVRLFMQK